MQKFINYIFSLIFFSVSSTVLASNESPLVCNANKVVHCTADSSCNSVDLSSSSTFDAISLAFNIRKKFLSFKSSGQKERLTEIKTITTLNDQLRLSGQYQETDSSEIIDYWTAVFTDNKKKVAITILRNEQASIIFATCGLRESK